MVKRQIVIVEDDQDIALLIELVLGDLYDIRICSSVKEATLSMDKQVPDLFLLDVMLPDGNGVELCKAVKADPQTSNVPVIMMSAIDEPKDSMADNFIRKPFNIETFKETIRNVLDNSLRDG